MSNEIFNIYFECHFPSFFIEGLYEVNQNNNEKIVNQINNSLIEIKISVIRKEIPENGKQNKVINIVKKYSFSINSKKAEESKHQLL